jgi:hypothetical protein
MTDPELDFLPPTPKGPKIKYTHQALIDQVIANPSIDRNELAKIFDVTPNWVSRITNSDSFLEALAARRVEIVNPLVTATVEERLKMVATKSLESVLTKLDGDHTIDHAMKAAELSTKALGYGARKENVAVQQTFVVQMPGKAPSAEVWLSQVSEELPPGLQTAGG